MMKNIAKNSKMKNVSKGKSLRYFGYCLNKEFGCVDSFLEHCIRCDDILDLDKCTKCEDGYDINEYGYCFKS